MFSPTQISTVESLAQRICGFLATHAASPTLLVVQHLWERRGESRPDIHLDSWVWIRGQLELLAQGGRLRCELRNGASLWSLR